MKQAVWALGLALGMFCAGVSAAEGIRPFELPGNGGRITALQDAANRMPAQLFFDTVPNSGFKPSQKDYAASVNVFLVEKGGKRILIDAGYPVGRGKLRDLLRTMRINPSAIDGVLITHIHPDHVGGLTTESGAAFFPRAEIFVAKKEYDAWKTDASRANLKRHFAPYEGRIRLFEYGRALPGGLLPELREGHTPGHTVFHLGEISFIGDTFHAIDLQVPRPTVCARYDMDPSRAVVSRKAVLRSGRKWLFGAHVPFPGCIRTEEKKGASGAMEEFSYRVPDSSRELREKPSVSSRSGK